jgi:hypothetical protein
MTKDELLKLADRVEAGEVTSEDFFMQFGVSTWMNWNEALTSLDAAKALHDAVLPGWSWNINDDFSATLFDINSIAARGEGKNPAAAWVAAILRAKAEELK